MESRKLLIYLAVLYEGDWDKIYDTVSRHEVIDEKLVDPVIKNLKSKVVTILDDDYPQQLKPIFKPPFVLFYHGNLALAKDKSKLISVVGCRENSVYGEEVTTKLVSKLSKEMVIVSGLARGIDGIAHRAAIMAHGKTIAVLGCGINVCYPPSNLDIYDEIKKKHLLLSEYPNLTQPQPTKFPFRNRIVAGLSSGLLVTEGQMYSGTSITATITLNSGGHVCCVPTHIGENSICNHLIANGAALVETVDDIYDEIEFRKHKPVF